MIRQAVPQVSFARGAATDLLSQLAKRMHIALGRPPKAEEFYPIRLEDIVQELDGWRLDFVAGLGFGLGVTIRGKCIFDEKRILIDLEQSAEQKRFSLAHEIGHAVLHDFAHGCSGDSVVMNRSVRDWGRPQIGERDNKAEREANIFAAELLMPPKAVRSRFEKLVGKPRLWLEAAEARQFYSRDISSREGPIVALADGVAAFKLPDEKSLAEFFGVSIAAMSRRLRELGLVFD